MPGFSSTYSPVFLALFLLISFAASYFFYKTSLVSNPKKYILISLKSLAFFLLLALFAEPVLSSLVNPDEEKLNVILVDNSRSNRLNSKDEQVKKIIADNNLLSGNYRVFVFSETVDELKSADSFFSDGYETDLSSALRNIKDIFPDRNYNSITVISDGIFTSGGNPLYEALTFQAPFVTYCIGDTVQQKDALIKTVSYNEKAFTNMPAKIRAFANVYGYPGGTLILNLYRESNLISTKTITLTGSQNYDAEFDVTENAPGKIKYRIEAENKDGELTYKNNYSEFYIKFTDNKVNILVISGSPGYDDAFVTGVLKRISNFNMTFRTAKTPSEFYEGAIDYKIFPELSALFFLNFPNVQTSAGIVSEIAEKVKTFHVPVIFFAGKNSDYAKLQAMDELIPFSISRANSGESLFSLQNISSAENPLSKLTEINTAAQIFRNVSGIQPKPGAVTLATDKFSGEPVLITRTSGDYKSTAFLGYGLWRWKLNSSSNGEKTMEGLLTEIINMTLQKERKTKLLVYPAKNFFDYSEKIKIFAEVYDENFSLTRNAVVNGKILRKDGSKVNDIKFTPDENRYSAVIDALAAGDYSIEAEAELNGNFYARDYSRFTSDSLNTEYLETKSNSDALRQLSLNTGGIITSTDKQEEISAVINKIHNFRNADFNQLKSIRFNLRENRFFLGLIILLFAAEWVIRKRNNIP